MKRQQIMVDSDQIKACLVDLGLATKDDQIDLNESLFDRGVIDSLGIAALVSMLSVRFGIVVPDEDLLPDHFDTISSIVSYVNNKFVSDQSSPA